jgi:hypothetical protein
VKVFISWSDEHSRSVASALSQWLGRRVLHSIDFWMSDEAIVSGSHWNTELAAALGSADAGIVCVTRSNQHAPWLMFEAGALANRLAASRLVPLVIDLPLTEVTGPLAAFQGRVLDHDGVHRLVRDLNAWSERTIDPLDLNEISERWWPDLAAGLQREEDKQKLLGALQADEYEWRSLSALGLLVTRPAQDIRDLLVEVGARADASRTPDRELWGLISRVGRQ